MCDIDHFKEINDHLGHQAGDEVLVAFTRILQANLREYDTVGRYGGEEFLVIASGPGAPDDDGLYERLRRQVAAAEIQAGAGKVSLTASIGTARAGETSTVDLLIAAADKALYQAKAEGRNRVVKSGEVKRSTICNRKSAGSRSYIDTFLVECYNIFSGSSVAQSAEQMAVNHKVGGSSPS